MSNLFTANHLTFILCILSISIINSNKLNQDFYQNLEELQDIYNNYYDDDYFDDYYDDNDDDETEIEREIETEQQETSSIYDYTLYYNDYNFDWDKEEDWDKINIKNHKDEDIPYQEIEACTFEIASIQKRVCVHSKRGGGFTIGFKSSHRSSSLHRNLLNEEEEENDDESGFYDNIELDWDNDADWSEISHSLSDYDENTINTKYMNDMIQLKYAHNLLTEYKNALDNYKTVFFQNYGVYPNQNTLNKNFLTKTSGISAKAAHEQLLNNYANYDYYDDDYYDYGPMDEPFTQEFADTLTGSGGDDMYNLYGTAAQTGGYSQAGMGMNGLMSLPGVSQMFPGMQKPPGLPQMPGMPSGAYPGMNNPYGPQGQYGQQMVNSLAQGMDAKKYVFQ